MKTGVLLALAVSLGAAPSLSAQNPPRDSGKQETDDDVRERRRRLGQLSLEELMNVQVTIAAKHEQKLITASSAITVIRSDDIRRMGATSIAEALRMVPGFQVGRIDANKWAITARGFNELAASKLLVLIDGRSVYDPLFSGVFWDIQDLMLEDVDRIEVVRGPGATLWGANAVNGVINVITKTAEDTQGGLAQAAAGTEFRSFGGARYGGRADENTYYRIYGKFFNHAESQHGEDAWNQGRAGFRVDWTPAPESRLTVQGDYYQGTYDSLLSIASLTAPFTSTFGETSTLSGGNILIRGEHEFSGGSHLSAQLTCDATNREIPSVLGIERETMSLDAQHRFDLLDSQQITWGAGYRHTMDRVDNTFTLSFDPDHRTDDLVSSFIQDEITLVENRLTFTAGSKFEYNTYTGFEYQPSLRLSWTPDKRHAAWAAVSRAVRTPSRVEDDFRVNRAVIPGVPTLVSFFGDRDVEAEDLLAAEAGYRTLLGDTVSADLATFYNEYDDLVSVEPGTAFPEPLPVPAHVVSPLLASNRYEGRTYGVEVAATWRITEDWRLYGAYAFFRMNLERDSDSMDLTTERREGKSPRHQFFLRSTMDLPYNLELDLMGRFVDVLPTADVDSYIEAEVRIGWSPLENLDVALVGQNLVHDEHAEYDRVFPYVRSEVERGAYLMLTVRF